MGRSSTPRSTAHVRRPVSARRALERSGWRTMLEFHENHVRDGSGRLVAVEAVWVAEAEDDCGTVVSVCSDDPHRLWPMLARRVDARIGPSLRRSADEGRALR